MNWTHDAAGVYRARAADGTPLATVTRYGGGCWHWSLCCGPGLDWPPAGFEKRPHAAKRAAEEAARAAGVRLRELAARILKHAEALG